MHSKYKTGIKDLVLAALFVAVIAVCSFVTVPLGAVPFTLQTVGVFCAAGLLGSKRGTAAVCFYLILGAVGLPVFHGFQGGIGVLFGATGGFLLSFPLVAFFIGLAAERFGRSFKALLLFDLLGTAISYIIGVLWYWLVFTGSTGAGGLLAAVMTCVVPFVAADILKALLSAVLVSRLSRFVR